MAGSIEKIEIFWPASQTTQTFTNLSVDHNFQVKEGDSHLQTIACKRYAFDTVPLTKDSLGMQH
jgi:hypothetical protein